MLNIIAVSPAVKPKVNGGFPCLVPGFFAVLLNPTEKKFYLYYSRCCNIRAGTIGELTSISRPNIISFQNTNSVSSALYP
jgi:hypothetical protein